MPFHLFVTRRQIREALVLLLSLSMRRHPREFKANDAHDRGSVATRWQNWARTQGSLLLLSSGLLCDIALWLCCDGLSNFPVLCPHLRTISTQASTGHPRGSLGSVSTSLCQAPPLRTVEESRLPSSLLKQTWQPLMQQSSALPLLSIGTQRPHPLQSNALAHLQPAGRTEKPGLRPGSLATAASNAHAFLFVFFLSESRMIIHGRVNRNGTYLESQGWM